MSKFEDLVALYKKEASTLTLMGCIQLCKEIVLAFPVEHKKRSTKDGTPSGVLFEILGPIHETGPMKYRQLKTEKTWYKMMVTLRETSEEGMNVEPFEDFLLTITAGRAMDFLLLARVAAGGDPEKFDYVVNSLKEEALDIKGYTFDVAKKGKYGITLNGKLYSPFGKKAPESKTKSMAERDFDFVFKIPSKPQDQDALLVQMHLAAAKIFRFRSIDKEEPLGVSIQDSEEAAKTYFGYAKLCSDLTYQDLKLNRLRDGGCDLFGRKGSKFRDIQGVCDALRLEYPSPGHKYTQEEAKAIKKAALITFRAVARQNHPDHGGSGDQIKTITEAKAMMEQYVDDRTKEE
jgi:hypothetical protein